jgi:hypothetical protein
MLLLYDTLISLVLNYAVPNLHSGSLVRLNTTLFPLNPRTTPSQY